MIGLGFGEPQGPDGLAGRTAVADAAHTATAAEKLIAYTSLTAPRTVALPAASAYPAGQVLRVQDESGQCRPWRPISVAPNGGDAVQGTNAAMVLIWPGETIALQSNGVDAWSLLGRSHPRALYQEVPPRGGFAIDDDCFSVAGTASATGIASPFVQAVIGSGGGGGNFAAYPSLTGAVVASTAASGSANDRVYLRTLGATSLYTGAGPLFSEHRLSLLVAPDGTNDFVVVAGFVDVLTNAYSVDGAWWMIDRSVGNNWLCVTSNNSTRTVTDSGIPWTVGAWTLGVDIAGDGLSVKFYSGTTLAATVATNLPTANSTARAFGVAAGFYKKAGTANALDILALDRVRAFVSSSSLRST